MNILIYNCYQFDNPNRFGGGVSVYIKNIIPAFLDRGDKVKFCSAGHRYSLFSRKMKFKKTSNVYESRGVETFELHNSPLKTPAHDAFGSLEQALVTPKLENMFLDFVAENSIDEVHFHGIEGICTSVVRTLQARGNVTVKVWLHNYHWVCPQIELFRGGTTRCVDYAGGRRCVNCLSHIGNMGTLKNYQAVGDFIEKMGLSGKPGGDFIFGLIFNAYRTVGVFSEFIRSWFEKNKVTPKMGWRERRAKQTDEINRHRDRASIYVKWRTENAALLNQFVDQIYAVSNIVRDQYEARGVEQGKIKVTPIGMPDEIFDDSFRQPKKPSKKMRIGFLGYAIPSKGLDLLSDAISDIASEYSDKCSFFIVSTLSPRHKRDLAVLSEKVDVTVLEGYQRSEMGDILSELDLVVVPSVCWETYNQVAYESIKAHTPVLLSDTVGISMLLKDDKFIFKSSDKKDLTEKLLAFINSPSVLQSFWENEPELPSFDDHVQMLG